ncbi:hypothetical protein Ciccas_006896 [Cichlidogyrus casuarinus]|uniref:Uncharacterized protein n=1 Tax=Cichlidogyrus casuarinus TaxID=1844966 RepID=A0ABD2Q4E7_9PLAT
MYSTDLGHCTECGSTNLSELNDLCQKICFQCGQANFSVMSVDCGDSVLKENPFSLRPECALKPDYSVEGIEPKEIHKKEEACNAKDSETIKQMKLLLKQDMQRRHLPSRPFRISELFSIIFKNMAESLATQPAFSSCKDIFFSCCQRVWVDYLCLMGEFGFRSWASLRLRDDKLLSQLSSKSNFFDADSETKATLLNLIGDQSERLNYNRSVKMTAEIIDSKSPSPYPFWPGMSICFRPKLGGINKQLVTGYPTLSRFSCLKTKLFKESEPMESTDFSFLQVSETEQTLEQICNPSFENLLTDNTRKRSRSETSPLPTIDSAGSDEEPWSMNAHEYFKFFKARDENEMTTVLACLYVAALLTLEQVYPRHTPIITISDFISMCKYDVIPFSTAHLSINKEQFHYEPLHILARFSTSSIPIRKKFERSICFILKNSARCPKAKIPLVWLVNRYIVQFRLPHPIRMVAHSLLKECALFLDSRTQTKPGSDLSLIDYLNCEKYALCIILLALRLVFVFRDDFEKKYETVCSFLRQDDRLLSGFLKITGGDANFFSPSAWIREMQQEFHFLVKKDEFLHTDYGTLVSAISDMDSCHEPHTNLRMSDKAGCQPLKSGSHMLRQVILDNICKSVEQCLEQHGSSKNNETTDQSLAQEKFNASWQESTAVKADRGLVFIPQEWPQQLASSNIDIIQKVTVEQVQNLIENTMQDGTLEMRDKYKALGDCWITMLEQDRSYRIVRQDFIDAFYSCREPISAKSLLKKFYLDKNHDTRLLQALNLEDVASENKLKHSHGEYLIQRSKYFKCQLFGDIYDFLYHLSDAGLHFESALKTMEIVTGLNNHPSRKFNHIQLRKENKAIFPFLDLSPY